MELLQRNTPMEFLAQRFSCSRVPIAPAHYDCRNFSCSSYYGRKSFKSFEHLKPDISVCFRGTRFESRIRRHGFHIRRRVLLGRAMDDVRQLLVACICVCSVFGVLYQDSVGAFSFDDWGDTSKPIDYMVSSSEGEESDGEVILQPITDVDLPTSRERLLPPNDSITVTAHRLVTLGRTHKTRSTINGFLNTVALVSISTIFVLLVDHCAWRIVRLPLPPFYLMRPFLMSTILVTCFGFICIPLFRVLKLHAVVRKGAPQYSLKKRTPTMGGLYFVPIGVLVAESVVGFSSIEVSGAAATTIAFAAIGLLYDYLDIRSNNKGISLWIRGFLEVTVGAWFSYWLCGTDISTPYNMKMVVPLPSPWGLVCARNFYPILTSFCFLSTTNGVNSTDGLDGLAAGTAALAFIGMSIVVLPICSDLSVFGASMAGACIGFLFQNQYKASIFMGNTGALALGGALAAIASCTGMFFPLLISSGVYIVETLSVVIQVSLFKATKYFQGKGYRLFRMAPFHHHLQLCGIEEPIIVSAAYFVTSVLVLYASYIGLMSL